MTYDAIMEAYLVKEVNASHFLVKKLDHLHLKDVLKYECEFYLKRPLTPTQCKIIVAYGIMNHRLAIETRRW